MSLQFNPPRAADFYTDRDIDCQASIDGAFRDLWENIAAAGWDQEEIAGALYELTDNHLTALRENETVDRWLSSAKGRSRSCRRRKRATS